MTTEPTGMDPPRRQDLRLPALAVGAWVAAWLATSGDARFWLVGGVLAAGLAVVGGLRRRWLVMASGVLVAVTLATGALRTHQHQTSPLANLAQARALVVVDYRVDGDVRRSEGRFGPSASLPVTVMAVDGRGRRWGGHQALVLRVSGGRLSALDEHAVGSRWRATVRLSPTDRGDHRAAEARLSGEPALTAGPPAPLRAAEHVRASLRRAMESSAPEPRALVPSLVVGDTSQMTPRLQEEFARTGLSHLTAVSGANLAIMLAFLLIGARWVGVRGRWLTVVGLLTVVGFVLLCRAEPSVLRAAAMGLVMLAALGGNPGEGKGLRHLAGAMLGLLLLDPWLGRSAGFALSVLASGGIIACASAWREAMTWLPGPIAEAVAVPLSAQLATQPVVTALSGEVSMVGLVANALTGPLVGPATVLGFATAGLAVVCPPVAGFTGWLAGWCAQGIIWVAHAGAALPGAAWRWPAGAIGLALVTVGSAVAMVLAGAVLARRWAALACGVLMVVCLARAPISPGWPPRQWSVIGCDVGQGDAFLLRAGESEAVLVDTGPEPRALSHCLDSVGVRRIPLMVLTHYHADHIGGLNAVWGRVPVGHVLVSPNASPSWLAERVRRAALGAGASHSAAKPGERLVVGQVRWTTIGPLGDFAPSDARAATAGGESSAENDSSVMAVAEVAGLRVLMTGDAELAAQESVVKAGIDVRADVLKVAHHGSSRQSPELVRRSGARVALIGVGSGNSHGHPTRSALGLLSRNSMTVLRTDTQGAIAVGGARGDPVLTTQR